MDDAWRSGDALLDVLSALANPHRLRIISVLDEGRNYVSQLAREVGLSRPLLYMHLKKLEDAGLVSGSLELSEDGRAMKFYAVVKFDVHLTPQVIARAAMTLTDRDDDAEKES